MLASRVARVTHRGTYLLASDLGCQCTRRPGDEHAERLLLYERRRGGVGLAAQLLGALP